MTFYCPMGQKMLNFEQIAVNFLKSTRPPNGKFLLLVPQGKEHTTCVYKSFRKKYGCCSFMFLLIACMSKVNLVWFMHCICECFQLVYVQKICPTTYRLISAMFMIRKFQGCTSVVILCLTCV